MSKFIFGFHSVVAYIKATPDRTLNLYVNSDRQDKRLQEILNLANRHNVPITECRVEKLENLVAKNSNHQGVVAEIAGYTKYTLDEYLEHSKSLNSGIILILDGITDPQNLGSIIRTADCFGVGAIIVPKDNSANYENEVVSKVSSGAVYNLPIIVVNNISRAIEKVKEYEFWVAGTTLEKDSVGLFDFEPSQKIAWVMGNEGLGIRRLVKENCDYFVMIPQFGQTQSLNVAVATGVVLSYTRQLMK